MQDTTVIFDKSPLILSGLKTYLSHNGFTILNATNDIDDFYLSLVTSEPDFIIIDPLMISEKDFFRLREYQRCCKKSRLLVFTASESVLYLMRISHLRWTYFLHKSQSVEEIIRTLRYQDNYPAQLPVAINDGVTDNTPCQESMMESFTGRELQVLREIGAGKTNKIIACEMQLSNKTISTYRRSIMGKLDTNDLRVVIDFARRVGF